ncbi:MAG: hypothetical protein HY885_02025 [Deltaproteobacteria bacterium]|nr:hypothetical protein [Deltaproteobacteria bacterium]
MKIQHCKQDFHGIIIDWLDEQDAFQPLDCPFFPIDKTICLASHALISSVPYLNTITPTHPIDSRNVAAVPVMFFPMPQFS